MTYEEHLKKLKQIDIEGIEEVLNNAGLDVVLSGRGDWNLVYQIILEHFSDPPELLNTAKEVINKHSLNLVTSQLLKN